MVGVFGGTQSGKVQPIEWKNMCFGAWHKQTQKNKQFNEEVGCRGLVGLFVNKFTTAPRDPS